MSENPIGLSDSASTKLDSAVRNSQSAIRGYLLVALAASIWGTIGFFFRALHDEFGFAESTIAFLRPAIAAAILLPALALFQPRLLKISWRALPFFIAYGFGAALYNIFYTQAVVQTGVTTAAILLYTAPAFVSLIAWRAWNEPLDARKISAIILAFGGCVLVVRGYDLTQLRLNAAGVAFGVGAGLLYGVYSLFSKAAMRNHSAFTALVYALIGATFFLAFAQTQNSFEPLARAPAAWIPVLGLALGPTIGALILFNWGLKIVPASNASVVATIEPVMAALLAFLFLGEHLEIWQMIGGGLVIAGAVIQSAGN